MTCKNSDAFGGPSYLSNGTCVRFNTAYSIGDRVGGSWGNLDIIEGFVDELCTMEVSPATIKRKPNEDGFCMPMDGAGTWSHVKGHALSFDIDLSFAPNPDVVQ